MKKSQQIDYFAEPSSKEEAVIRRIKGNFRREFVMRAVLGEGIESVPPAWLEHDISSFLKDYLTSRHPRARGGEARICLTLRMVRSRSRGCRSRTACMER
jgi:hypothetical protein